MADLGWYHVEFWEERDRLGIWVANENGDRIYEVWDDDARQLFEDGFFKKGDEFKQSVIDYLLSVGIIKEPKTIHLTEKELDKVLNSALFTLSEILDADFYGPMKQELMQHNITHTLGHKKELFKGSMENVFREMKNALLLEGADK